MTILASFVYPWKPFLLIVHVQATAEVVPSKIAEMVIQGSAMSVTEVTKKLNKYEGGVEIMKLTARRLKTQQANIEAMKSVISPKHSAGSVQTAQGARSFVLILHI